MASTGIHRKIDDLGRVVIPVGVRRNLGIKEGDHLEVTVEGDRIILAKPSDRCALCSSDVALISARGRHICGQCVEELLASRDERVVVLDEPATSSDGGYGAASKTAW